MAKNSSLYNELLDVVDRPERPVNVGVHRLKILAIIHARNWADDVGIKFQWSKIAIPGQDAQYRVSALYDGWTLDYDDEWGHRYGDAASDANGVDDACWAGRFTGGGPRSDKAEDRAIALWAESIIALRMMATFETSHRDDQVAREFAETYEGGIIYPLISR